MKVLFVTNIPSPYRVNFFNELGKLCDLTVIFEKGYSSERNAEWRKYSFDNFNGIILDGISTSVDNAFSFKILKYLNQKWDYIIMAAYSTPTGMLAIQYMKSKHIPYWIEGDGGFAKSGKGFKEVVKKYFISGAQGYFSTSSEHDKYYLTYGAEPGKIFRYPFTSLKADDIVPAISDSALKKTLRQKLNLKENKIIISVGRFSYRKGYGKGYDILLKTVKYLSSDTGIYIIGDKPTEEFISLKNKHHLEQVHFLDFKKKDELFDYYYASDLFVLLSRGEAWGLVINEAMACGLPVITTDRCIAGLELVENDINGYIVPVDNVAETAEKIKLCLLPENNQKFSRKSLEKIQGYTFEKMAQRHIEVLKNNE